MNEFVWFLITLGIGAVGSMLARKAKIPAGGMVGAMVVVMAFNLLTEKGFFYNDLRTVVQIGSGAMIGARMKKSNVRALKNLVVPMVILWVFMIIMNVSVGSAMFAAGNLDAGTAFFASAPGGMADMSLIAADMGANPAYVAVLQLLRILTIIIFMPPIFKKLGAKSIASGEVVHHDATPDDMQGSGMRKKIERVLLTVAIGAVGGLIFRQLGVPAGPMIGSMVFVTVFSATTDKAYYPSPIRRYTQIITGTYIGMRMDRASFFTLPELVVPALILMASVFVFAFLTGYIIHKVTKMPLCTALMASTPGGLQEMSMLADDLGLDSPTIALLQSTRLMFVVAIFPTMLKLIVTYLL